MQFVFQRDSSYYSLRSHCLNMFLNNLIRNLTGADRKISKCLDMTVSQLFLRMHKLYETSIPTYIL